ncbi:hypothetical protein LTR56_026814 [Elasticomyces elasticus]|nr:hypothetical protein LTR56_026814 [Elasticomyces elasticus]KAK3624129.1 hypothetical protein LTR22_024114 [Elasticomyces elasticus]KAK4906239.1 hypothetical protein LTR49_024602 [Elasticomyces elasticus]KAK5744687.1 hypothetical protein LTS12_023366 [Elasticomyces elasticus]
MDKQTSDQGLRKKEVTHVREVGREERLAEYRQQEEKTMEMLKEVAKQRKALYEDENRQQQKYREAEEVLRQAVEEREMVLARSTSIRSVVGAYYKNYHSL